MSVFFVVGGARSGKSYFAEKLADDLSEKVAYLATAQVLDDEMVDRVRKHKIRRPNTWKTFEEAFEISSKVGEIKKSGSEVILLDCLTLFTSNVLLKDIDFENPDFDELMEKEPIILEEIKKFIKMVRQESMDLIIVSNEIGLGIIPIDIITRVYRDIIGKANQEVAKEADSVVSVISGIAVQIKPDLKKINL